MPSTRRALVTLFAILVGGALLTAADVVTRRDAARLQAKLDRIKTGRGDRRAAIRTTVSEVELNSYLRFELDDRLPAGISEPWVSIVGDGRISGRATVDLGLVGETRKSSGALDPFNYLTGRLPLLATGLLQTKNGVGNFVLESASVSGVPVPKCHRRTGASVMPFWGARVSGRSAVSSAGE